jgi:hypothetical protein
VLRSTRSLPSTPEQVRGQLRNLKPRQRIRACAVLRPGPIADPAAATKTALRSLARRWQALQAEMDDLDAQLTPLVEMPSLSWSLCPASAWTPPGSCW